jgi:EmrB/QacA subfamily drug resistance transporter
MMKTTNLQWLVLATVIVGTFLGRLDQTIVNLALPKMINDFGITVSTAGWIATAYIIANAVFVPVWGKLGDTIGRKKVYIAGFVLFIVSSVFAGLAWNFSSMIVFRIMQAIASSADYPTAMAILAVTFTDRKQRAQALGIWSSAFAASAVLGPLIGGPLIDTFNWRSIFLLNLPVGLIGLAMALAFVTESVAEVKSYDFDWWGAATLGGALASLVLVLDKGTDWGWLSSNSLISYLAVALFSAIFYLIERGHADAIVDFKFFKNPTFTNALANNFIVFMGMMGSVFLIPIFAQTFLGMTATEAGYLFIPMAIAMMIGAPIGGRLIGRIRPNIVIALSTLGAAIGIYLFSVLLDPRSGAIDIMFPLSIMAFSLGFAMAQRTSLITNSVPTAEVGVASSILALARNIAGAVGIAISGTLVNNLSNDKVIAIARYSTINSANPIDIGKAIGLMELKAQVSAYAGVFEVSAIIVLIGAIAALWIKAHPYIHPSEKESRDPVVVLD